MQQLKQLEAQHPDLITPDSPTQRVGGRRRPRSRRPACGADVVLDNAFSEQEVRDFDRRVRERLKTQAPISYSAEPKLDGLAVSLIYRRGSLERAATRAMACMARMSRQMSAPSVACHCHCVVRHPILSKCARDFHAARRLQTDE